MIIQFVKLHSRLSEEELLEVAEERRPQFEALEGLLQKYYVSRGEPGAYGGIYVWDSEASMKAFRESELAGTIAAAYQVTGPPEIEVMEVLFPLRDPSS